MPTIHLQVAMTFDDDSLTTMARFFGEVLEKADARRSRRAVATEEWPSPQARWKMTPKEASQHALFGGKKPPEEMGLLIDTKEAAKLLRVSIRTVWTLYNSGKTPDPVRIGRTVRWRYLELVAWVTAGCPPRNEWKWPQNT